MRGLMLVVLDLSYTSTNLVPRRRHSMQLGWQSLRDINMCSHFVVVTPGVSAVGKWVHLLAHCHDCREWQLTLICRPSHCTVTQSS
jgi:hypothetical protein